MTRRQPGSGTLTERSPGTWRLRVFIGTDPVTGKPRQRTRTVHAKNKTAANKALAAFVTECMAEPKPGPDATVGLVVEEWLRQVTALGRSPRTLHEARRTLDRVLIPRLGTIKAATLTPYHIDQLYQALIGDGLSAATVRRYHAILTAALALAVKWDWLERNPADKAALPALGHQVLRVPTHDEVKRLLTAAKDRNPRWGMLLALALATGARRGELCALRWTDVFDERVRIARSIYRAGQDRGEKGTKGGRERWVSVGPVVIALLNDWWDQVHETARDAGVTLVPDAFIVSPMPDGSRPVNPDTLSSVVHDLAVKLGMPHVHLHSLRHFAATELIGSGVNPRDAAEILGHADPALTLRVYTHSTAARQREAADVLGRALGP